MYRRWLSISASLTCLFNTSKLIKITNNTIHKSPVWGRKTVNSRQSVGALSGSFLLSCVCTHCRFQGANPGPLGIGKSCVNFRGFEWNFFLCYCYSSKLCTLSVNPIQVKESRSNIVWGWGNDGWYFVEGNNIQLWNHYFKTVRYRLIQEETGPICQNGMRMGKWWLIFVYVEGKSW